MDHADTRYDDQEEGRKGSKPLPAMLSSGPNRMDTVMEGWKAQLIALSPAERAEIAHFLLTSLDTEDEHAEAAWNAEASRRVEEFLAGKAQGYPIEDVLTELREQYS